MPVPEEKSPLTDQKEPLAVTYKPGPTKILLSWTAASRPFKRRSKEYFTTVGAIIVLCGLILMAAREFMAVAPILGLAFIVYVLSTVEPEKIDHQITNKGIVSGNKTYQWNTLGRFWLSKKWGNEILNIEHFLTLPSRLTLLLGETSKEQVKKILEEYLMLERPEKSLVDKISGWLTKKIPLEE